MKNSALKDDQFARTATPPNRRVHPEPKAPAATKPAVPAPPQAEPKAGKLAALLLLLCLLLALPARASGFTYTVTNDLAAAVIVSYYSNSPAGYVYFYPTNMASGQVLTLNLAAVAAQGVAVQGTNNTFARLTPLVAGIGTSTSFCISNTAVIAAGVPTLTSALGTNVVTSSSFTAIPPGTNVVSPISYNTNLP